MGIEILFRRETADEMKVAADAAHFDSVDLITGPDGSLGFVALQNGRRVCQQCGGHFNSENSRLRMTPVSLYSGAPPVYLHAKCEAPPTKLFNFFKGLGTRRKVASIVKGSESLEQAKNDGSK